MDSESSQEDCDFDAGDDDDYDYDKNCDDFNENNYDDGKYGDDADEGISFCASPNARFYQGKFKY